MRRTGRVRVSLCPGRPVIRMKLLKELALGNIQPTASLFHPFIEYALHIFISVNQVLEHQIKHALIYRTLIIIGTLRKYRF